MEAHGSRVSVASAELLLGHADAELREAVHQFDRDNTEALARTLYDALEGALAKSALRDLLSPTTATMRGVAMRSFVNGGAEREWRAAADNCSRCGARRCPRTSEHAGAGPVGT